MKQGTFAGLAFDAKKKRTRRELFLAEMDKVVPWARLVALIEPHYPKAAGGRRPMELESMLRVYFMQQWYALSDPAMEEALYDMESMRRFAGIELIEDAVPDETTILKFRHLLEKHRLTERVFAEVAGLLDERRLLLKGGTIVDATIIAAPSSTKNETQTRDPAMSQTKKGSTWYFGMKAHIGVDAKTGLIHTVATTTAAVHDGHVLPELLHGEETVVYGDKGYGSHTDRALAQAAGIELKTMRRASRHRALTERERTRNRRIASIRSKVEFPFRVLKRQFGYLKVRYRGLAKNTAQLFTLFALTNLYLARRRLLAQGAWCVQ
jgi:IS5 family transposase